MGEISILGWTIPLKMSAKWRLQLLTILIHRSDQDATSEPRGVNWWLIFQGDTHICRTQFFQQGQAGLLWQPEALGEEAEGGVWQKVNTSVGVLSSVDNFVWAETHLRLIHLYWLQIFLSVASSSSVGEIRWWIFQVFCRVSHPNSQTWSWLRAERQWAWTWRAEMGLTKENVIDESFKKNMLQLLCAEKWEHGRFFVVVGKLYVCLFSFSL